MTAQKKNNMTYLPICSLFNTELFLQTLMRFKHEIFLVSEKDFLTPALKYIVTKKL